MGMEDLLSPGPLKSKNGLTLKIGNHSDQNRILDRRLCWRWRWEAEEGLGLARVMVEGEGGVGVKVTGGSGRCG